MQFSGPFVPVSSLTGGAWFAAAIFPSTYFQAISVERLQSSACCRYGAMSLPRFVLIYFVTSVVLESRKISDAASSAHHSAWNQELLSHRDPVLLFLIAYSFTFSYTPSKAP